MLVDEAIVGFNLLAEGLARPMPAVRLERGSDPLGQIADALAARRGTDRLHIVAHGGPGLLSLGGYRFDEAALENARATRAVGVIRSWLLPGARVALWAAGVAAGPVGRAFVARLEEIFGCPVAASSRPMGEGQEWVLTCGPKIACPVQVATASDYPLLLGLCAGRGFLARDVAAQTWSLKRDRVRVVTPKSALGMTSLDAGARPTAEMPGTGQRMAWAERRKS